MREFYLNKWMFVEGFKNVGELSFNFKQQFKFEAPLTPAFEIIEEKKRNYSLNPCYLDVDGNAYYCPVSIVYILLEKIQYIDDKGLHIVFKLCSKDFTSSIHIEVGAMKNKIHIKLSDLILMINVLNEYIHSGNSLSNLNLNRINDFYRFSPNKIDIIINCFHYFTKIQFYEDGYSPAPGKDNITWEEIEISNIPESNYLKELIFSILNKKYKNTSYKEYGILVVLESGGSYQTCSRIAIKDEAQYHEFRENLKLRMFEELDVKKYLWEWLIKK